MGSPGLESKGKPTCTEAAGGSLGRSRQSGKAGNFQGESLHYRGSPPAARVTRALALPGLFCVAVKAWSWEGVGWFGKEAAR